MLLPDWSLHLRAINRAMARVNDEDEAALVRAARAALPEMEARADQDSEPATARVVEVLSELRAGVPAIGRAVQTLLMAVTGWRTPGDLSRSS